MGRRRFQIGLRSLLVVVAIAAVLSFRAARIYRSARDQRAVIEGIAEGGGIVQFDRGVWPPDWLREAVGEEYFRRASVVDFGSNRGRKPGTGEPKATDENLKLLESLADVEALELGHHEEVDDRALAHLEPLKKLSVLYLQWTGVRGPGLEHVARLPRLHSISLSHAALGDEGLEHLGGMAQLKWAMLDHTGVTDAGMPALAGAQGLEALSLRNTAISDAGLEHLGRLHRLESLDVAGTRVTAEGVGRLRRALPNCRVSATFGLGLAAVEGPLFPEGHRPGAAEVNARLKALGIDGEAEADASRPGAPIVSLRLFDCTLSDEAVLALIEQMPHLEVLNLRRGLVGDGLLAGLPARPIRSLSLQETRVTDAGLAHLPRLSGLKELELDGTAITDEGLDHLRGIITLSRIGLDLTRATRSGISRLRDALPGW